MANGTKQNNHSTNGKDKNGKIKKINFLFVEWYPINGDLAWQLKKEGHRVKMYSADKGEADVYDGFLEKTGNWRKEIDWADVIIFSDIGFGKEAERLRKKGKLVIGGSEYTDRLEENREFGQEEMKKYGMNILPFWNFSNFEEGIEFIQKNPDRYVFKPSNADPTLQKDLLFISEQDDSKDLIEMLEQNKKYWVKLIPNFQLQKYANGVEIAVGAFFNGKKFIYPVNVNFEHKRMFPGELGPFTGEMGTLMFWSQPNTIFKTTLEKMEPALTESGYIGYIDINCIVNGRGIYPLEFTSRFGYPTISVQMEGITMTANEFLMNLVQGDDFEIKTKSGFQIGVVVVVPSFFEDSDTSVECYRNLSIHFRKDNLDGIHIGDVKLEDRVWRIAGTCGYALIVTGSGSTVNEARRQVYSRIRNVKIQNMVYRVDIGLRWLQDSDHLQTWGYLY